ncbi:MAG: 30S ribosomal protein S6 [Acidobacteriota bacterium]
MRQYEVVFILAPHLSEEEADAMALAMQRTAEKKGATFTKVDKWGKRRLAYNIEKQREGYYFLFAIDTNPDAINELERKFKQTDEVIRFMTVRTDLEQKALAKRLSLRQRDEAKKAEKRGTAQPSAETRDRESSGMSGGEE